MTEVTMRFDIRGNSSVHSYITCRMNDLHLPRMLTNWGKPTFIFQAPSDYNNLDNDIKTQMHCHFFRPNSNDLQDNQISIIIIISSSIIIIIIIIISQLLYKGIEKLGILFYFFPVGK